MREVFRGSAEKGVQGVKGRGETGSRAETEVKGTQT